MKRFNKLIPIILAFACIVICFACITPHVHAADAFPTQAPEIDMFEVDEDFVVLTMKMSPHSSAYDGYEIQFSTSPDFTINCLNIVEPGATIIVPIFDEGNCQLSPSTMYYVRVRGFADVSSKQYTNWSTTRTFEYDLISATFERIEVNYDDIYLRLLNGRVYELMDRNEKNNCFETNEFGVFEMMMDRWQILPPNSILGRKINK